jgi:hypothetical protein
LERPTELPQHECHNGAGWDASGFPSEARQHHKKERGAVLPGWKPVSRSIAVSTERAQALLTIVSANVLSSRGLPIMSGAVLPSASAANGGPARAYR